MKLKKWVEEEIRRIKENGFWFWSETVAPYKDTDPEIKLLRETREQFQDILAKANRENLIANMLNPSAPLTPAVALKHAMIASDVGAELLDRAKDFIIFYKITRLTVARPGEPLILSGTLKEGSVIRKSLRLIWIYFRIWECWFSLGHN